MIPESALLVWSVTVSFGTCLEIEYSHDVYRVTVISKEGAEIWETRTEELENWSRG